MRYVSQGLSATNADVDRRLRQVVGAEREIHLSALACAQVNALKSAQTPYRRLLTGPASDVQLHYFIAVPGRSVPDRCLDRCSFRCPLRDQPEYSMSNSSIRSRKDIGLALKIPVGAALHGVIGEWRQLITLL